MNKTALLACTEGAGITIAAALLDAGILDAAAARRAREVASASGDSIVAVIHQLALADDAIVTEVLSESFGVPQATTIDLPPTAIEVASVSVQFLRRKRVLPLGWSNGNLLVGVIDPEPSDGLAALAFAAQCAAEPRLISVSAQQRAFDTLYGAAEAAAREEAPVVSIWSDDAQRMRDQSGAGPAVRIVDALLERALEENASDIHIEPLPDRVRVRFRVDGGLRTVREEPAQLAAPIAARIKVLADMDIADRRRAQDGRTSLAAKGRPVDVRISTVPSAYGETIVLRLLRRDAALLDLAALEFTEPFRAIFEYVMRLRRGLFLITGPTGSGKTTSLYAMIERLRQQPVKILSVEDPIEYFFPDITQVQVNEDAGLTFPTALRSFLRQDPDIILIGEIRDAETARIAIQAALTGHLVLATLHTSDAPGAIARLADMGIDRYLVAATLTGVVSQRLVRKLCAACKAERPPNAAERGLVDQTLGRASIAVATENGCAQCRHTGYAGRIAIAEGFLVDDALREAINDATGANLATALKARRYEGLVQAAARLASSGAISPAELQALALA